MQPPAPFDHARLALPIDEVYANRRAKVVHASLLLGPGQRTQSGIS